MYQHDWRAGDLVIWDNLAVAHLAAPATQSSVEDIGLRVLHRVVVAGEHRLPPLGDSHWVCLCLS